MNKHITQGRHKFKVWKNSPWLMVTRRIKNRGGLWRCYWYNPLTGQFTKYLMEGLCYRAMGKRGKDSAYSLLTGDPFTENPRIGSPFDDPFTFVRQGRKYLSGAGKQFELFPFLGTQKD